MLLDVHMPDGGGVEVIRRAARGRERRPCFLALSVSDAAEDVIAVIRAGARGYVTKTSPATSWPTRSAACTRATPSSPAPGRLRAGRLRRPAPQPETELDALTAREREVLQHIARGYMYKEIALRLDISPKTVEAHVSSVLRKLQLSSRHELTRWAAERGLDALEPPTPLVPLRHRAVDLALHVAVLDRAALVVDVLALRHAPAPPSRAGR